MASTANWRGLGLSFEILQIPGHTLSHIAFWGHGAVFCGDTLFSAGCGRMFEGTPKQMNASLDRLRNLPPETQVYCGHEYSKGPPICASRLDGRAGQRRCTRISGKRGENSCVRQSHPALELEFGNPRESVSALRQAQRSRRRGTALGRHEASRRPEEVFAVLRAPGRGSVPLKRIISWQSARDIIP